MVGFTGPPPKINSKKLSQTCLAGTAKKKKVPAYVEQHAGQFNIKTKL